MSPRLTRNHYAACRCTFCAVKRARGDRAAVLAATRPWTAGHADGCVCVVCGLEREVSQELDVWEVLQP